MQQAKQIDAKYPVAANNLWINWTASVRLGNGL